MRHVTDGELHAFLDGALDLLPEDRGEEVREHISTCSACRERLQDEEFLRSQVGSILGNPDLGAVGFPTFEELRERAEAPRSDSVSPTTAPLPEIHYRGPVRGLPLAWAATIVLALGVGWMGGKVWRTLPEGGRPGGPASILSSAGRPAAESADLNSIPEPSAVQAATEDPQQSASLPREASEGLRRVAPTDQDPSLRQADIAPLESRLDASGGVVAQIGQIIDSSAAGGAPPAMSSMEVPAASDFAPRARKESPEGFAVKAADLTNSLALRGLKVLSTEWEERVPGEKAFLIRQLLSAGDTLELRYLGMLLGTEPAPRGLGEGGIPPGESSGGRVYANVLEATLPPGWHQVVMERERGLLVARAPMSEANLKALLKTLR